MRVKEWALWQFGFDSFWQSYAAAFAPPLVAADDFVDFPVADIVFALASTPAEPADFDLAVAAAADFALPPIVELLVELLAAFASLALLSLNPRSSPSSPVDSLTRAPCFPW